MAAGVFLGLAGALGLSRLLASFLYGVKSNDLVTFAAVSTLLLLVALLASWLPARRAARMDPLLALKHD